MELDRMDGDQLKELSKAGLKTDIRMSKNTWDTETGGGISFEGIGSTTKESAPEEFTISNETPEVLMNTDLKVVIKIWGTTKIFEYGKQESIKATGALKDVKTSAKLVSQWLQGDYGTIKDKSENMKGTEAVNFGASRWEPTFYVNVEDNMTGLEADDKATITKIDKSTAVPSVTEMLHLLNSLGWSTNETKKFQTIYTS